MDFYAWSVSKSEFINILYGGIRVDGSIINLDEQQHIILHATGFPFYSTEDSDAITSLHDALTYWVRTSLSRFVMCNVGDPVFFSICAPVSR